MFDWTDMRFFLALAEEGTLSNAARSLQVDHATIARHVTRLEQALGETLVERFSKRWRMTQVGEEVAQMAQGMQAQAHAVERAMQARHKAGPVTVRVSAPPALASHFLAPRLAQLQHQHPDLNIALSGGQAVASLSRQDADIAVRLLPPTEVSSVTRRIGQVSYGLYAAPGYTESQPEAWRFISYDISLDHVPEQAWLRDFAGERRIAFRSNDLMSQLAAVRAGIGIAALPRFLAQNDQDVVAVPDALPMARDIHLVVHADLQRNATIRIVLDFIARHIGADLPA